jgi:hypothetical protein
VNNSVYVDFQYLVTVGYAVEVAASLFSCRHKVTKCKNGEVGIYVVLFHSINNNNNNNNNNKFHYTCKN